MIILEDLLEKKIYVLFFVDVLFIFSTCGKKKKSIRTVRPMIRWTSLGNVFFFCFRFRWIFFLRGYSVNHFFYNSDYVSHKIIQNIILYLILNFYYSLVLETDTCVIYIIMSNSYIEVTNSSPSINCHLKNRIIFTHECPGISRKIEMKYEQLIYPLNDNVQFFFVRSLKKYLLILYNS